MPWLEESTCSQQPDQPAQSIPSHNCPEERQAKEMKKNDIYITPSSQVETSRKCIQVATPMAETAA
jgi:hypothetical protein